jgi:hypothetical protein
MLVCLSGNQLGLELQNASLECSLEMLVVSRGEWVGLLPLTSFKIQTNIFEI